MKKLFESRDGIPDDMLFIVDECTDGGGISVGMTWYVGSRASVPEREGRQPLPHQPRSASSARAGRRTPAKLGDVSFSIIRAVAPLVKKQLRAQRRSAGTRRRERRRRL